MKKESLFCVIFFSDATKFSNIRYCMKYILHTPRNVCFISVMFLYIPKQTFSSFPNCLKNNPLQPSLSPKQKKFSFSEEHLLFSNVWISINNPRFPLHKDINNCSALKPPLVSDSLNEESGRGGTTGGFAGMPMLGQRWGRADVAVGPLWDAKTLWLHWRPPPEGIFDGFFLCFEQPAGSWTVDPAQFGHGMEREGIGWDREGKMPPYPRLDVSGGASPKSSSRLDASHQS